MFIVIRTRRSASSPSLHFILPVWILVANAALPFPDTRLDRFNFVFDASVKHRLTRGQRSTKKHVDAAPRQGGEPDQRNPIINGMSPHACNMRSRRANPLRWIKGVANSAR